MREKHLSEQGPGLVPKAIAAFPRRKNDGVYPLDASPSGVLRWAAVSGGK